MSASTPTRHTVLVVGGGSAGIATAASLLKRLSALYIAIIEPADTHYYQPGFTMVGGGIFTAPETHRPMAEVMPRGVSWIKAAVRSFTPEEKLVTLEDGRRIGYQVLILAAGLVLDWDAVAGLSATLGKNGVTSNYRFDLAPYTWQLVQQLQRGTALFTQPPMPIKCAGAPQKAMYLSCDAWRRRGVLKDISVAFHTAAPALFGVADYVPALMRYVQADGIDLNLRSRSARWACPSRARFQATHSRRVTRWR